MQIQRLNSKDEATAAAGEYLNALLIENKKYPILLMLSAGSALSILDFVGDSAIGENLTISILDERYSLDPKINNFHQLQQTDFYTLAFAAEASFFGTLPRPDDTQDSLAQRWEKNLRNWREENPKGVVIATLGMGADGHLWHTSLP
jgi:6-phosphogluconolactonase/glucosamine-6-phosphate isomerase/deaminase